MKGLVYCKDDGIAGFWRGPIFLPFIAMKVAYFKRDDAHKTLYSDHESDVLNPKRFCVLLAQVPFICY